VIGLPPKIYGGALILGILLQLIDPALLSRSPTVRWSGAVLLALGLGLAVWGRRTLERAGTTVNPFGSTTRLVTEGPFRFSRNPLYVSLTLGYLGITLLLNAVWPLLLLPPLLLIVQLGVVGPEERYLEETFGDEYRDYRSRVRRWF